MTPGTGTSSRLEHLPIPSLKFGIPINTPTEVSLDLLVHVRRRSADEAFDDVGLRQGPSKAGNDLCINSNGQPLAVD